MTEGTTGSPSTPGAPVAPTLASPLGDAGVSAANWLDPRFNAWSMWNVGELMPTQPVSRGTGPVAPLPRSPQPLELGSVPVTRLGGTVATVADVLADTFTDAFAVLAGGEVVAESYVSEGGAERAHAVLSVTKSVVGCVAGILIERGQLAQDRDVVAYVPELATSGYAGATVRDLLDMRSGVLFVEEYANPAAHVRLLDEWMVAGNGLYAFLATLEADHPHGGPFLYRSSETDVLGWVCERAAERPMTELMSELVWAAMGAERDAAMICDALGVPVHDGGLVACLPDLLRFGRLLLAGGSVERPDGGEQQVVPAGWVRQAWAVDADVRTAFLESPSEQSFRSGWYRNQLWFRPGEYGDLMLCLGIHGQLIYVSRRTGTVCVKLSSWPDAQNPAYLHDTLRACDAVSGAVTGQAGTGEPHRLPGVVSGIRRGGGDASRRSGSER